MFWRAKLEHKIYREDAVEACKRNRTTISHLPEDVDK